MTGQLISAEELRELFETFTSTAFRMEALPQVALAYEAEVLSQFLDGTLTATPTEIDWWRPWLQRVETLSATGRLLQRVRLIDNPLTDYQRFTMWGGTWNERAGEVIRYLPRHTATGLNIPTDHDWWLFDSTVLVLMLFDETGALAGRELVTDRRVAAHLAWRDLALQHGEMAREIAA